MEEEDSRARHRRIAELLTASLGKAQECSEVVEDYERVIGHFWQCTARFLGRRGTSAVFKRSVSLASEDAGLLRKVRIGDSGIDLSELRAHVASEACDIVEVAGALTHSLEAIVHTLSELTGDTLIESLLCYLEEE